MAELNVYKETSVPASAVPNAWYLIKEGANPFFTLRVADSAGTLIPLGMDVLGTLLAGYSTGANSSIASTDSVLQAFQKTQGQINNLSSAIAGGVKVPLPLDASGNPNYPAATKGDSYIITVSGKIGGALGIDVAAGDVVNALNNNAGGNQSEVGSDWYIIEGNKDLANDTTIGLVRRATIGEVDAGTDVNAYVSSGRLRAGVLATEMLGLSIGVAIPVVAGDNLITTIGKIQAQINNRVVSNSAIVAGTHTKISYDVKGLVTGGANLLEADIPALSIGKITGLQSEINGKISGAGTTNFLTKFTAPGIIGNSRIFDNGTTNLRFDLGATGVDFLTGTFAANFIRNINVLVSGSAASIFSIGAFVGSVQTPAAQIWGILNGDGDIGSIAFHTRQANILEERWRITGSGIFQSPGAQTIQAATGNLTLGSFGGNGSVILSPHGTGAVRVGGTIPNAVGNFAVYSATGVLQQRTPAQVLDDIGAQAAINNINQIATRSYNDLQDLPSLNFVPATRNIANGAGITGGGNLSVDRTIGLTGLALAFHNLATNGFAVRTAAGVAASRVMTGSNSINVANGDGVAGNPTFTMRYAGTIAW